MGTTSQKGYSFWKQADASPRHEATKGRQFDREFACREKSQERAAGSKHNKNKGRKMRRLFGTKKPKAPKATLSDATKNLDTRAGQIDVKIRKLDQELLRYKDQMSRMRPGAARNGVKQRAMRVLKQKRMYEAQRDQLMQQSFNMEQADFTQQQLKDTVLVVESMTVANQQLKQQFKTINIDNIEDTMDDMQDLLEQNEEIQEALSQTFSSDLDIDEADLDAELDMLGEEFEMGLEDDGMPSYLTDAMVVPDGMPGMGEAVPAGGDGGGAEAVDEFGLPIVASAQ